ncbi:MAG TPA: hypothetical protein PKC74_07605 [Turneriella sp.]|nr:hypothetical protein [Turneriella sp.]
MQIAESNIFSANTSYLDGGGLYFEHNAVAAVSVKGNYFYKNTCTDPACGGGAGLFYRGGNMAYTIRYNTFVSNNSAGTSASGGGMLLNLGGYTSANATVQENYFYQNTASVAGGGLFITAVASPASTLKFNSVFDRCQLVGTNGDWRQLRYADPSDRDLLHLSGRQPHICGAVGQCPGALQCIAC